ncbi:MAG: siderophore-interacting protein [Pseudomonadota bacterium]
MAKRPAPRLLQVAKAWHLTPHMIRVTFAGPALEGMPEGREGANCKILLPDPSESLTDFGERLAAGTVKLRRTYTVRAFRADKLELDIDFVDHGEGGPASAWARAARPGSFLGFSGPGPVKVQSFHADSYLLAADMSALPVVSATLEAMPRDATGLALLEVTSAEDKQTIDAPAGIEMRWLIHPHAHSASSAQIDAVRQMPWPDGRVQTCIAGEHGTVRDLRSFLLDEKRLDRADTYIAGYWKIGLVEDEHQELKRAEPA